MLAVRRSPFLVGVAWVVGACADPGIPHGVGDDTVDATSGTSDEVEGTVGSTAEDASEASSLETGGTLDASSSGSEDGRTAETTASSPTSTSTDDGANDDADATTGSGEESPAESDGAAESSTGGTEIPPATWPQINGIQWSDVDGRAIQAHGGGMLKVGEDYYWFGENRNPDGTFFAVSAYRSRDLQRWEHAHDVLTMNSDGDLQPANIERPKVVYNASTGKYVMWMHWENGRDYGEARAAVASSDTVDGDYTYHGSFRPLQDTGVVDHDKPGYMSRDCTLFVDDDGTGYFLSASNENYDLHLYRLSSDYLSIERREALLFEGGHREAPALFKRGNVYFLLTSGSTGWSPNQAQYATSTSLGSGWSNMRNVADGTTFHSQSTYVLPVEGSGGTSFLYLGDRWAGAWSGRVNDSSYVWQPISFPSDTSMEMTWSNTVEIDAEAGVVSGAVNTFAFVNKRSGLALSVEGPASEDGADVVQRELADQASPQWRFNYDGEGHFRLTNEDGGKVLDVPDESEEPGVAVHVWEDLGGDNQGWLLIDLGEGEYRVRNKKSGLYLGVVAGATNSGARVEQQQESATDEQVWSIEVFED